MMIDNFILALHNIESQGTMTFNGFGGKETEVN